MNTSTDVTSIEWGLGEYQDKSGKGVHEKVFELTQSYLENRKILMAGAGQGQFEARLIQAGISAERITPLDIYPQNYKLPRLTCLKANLNESMPVPDQSFGICYAIEVIEHLENPKRLITEAYRVLEPGGLLVITTPNVHSLMQKIRYLLTDRFDYFAEGDFKGSGHIHPIFDWLLERFYRGKFQRILYGSNEFHLRFIPGLPAIPMPKHRFFAVNNIYILRKT